MREVCIDEYLWSLYQRTPKRDSIKVVEERKVHARYRHAQLSAVRLAGDISGKMDDVSLDELLVTIRQEWAKLSPLIDLKAEPDEQPEALGIENQPPPQKH